MGQKRDKKLNGMTYEVYQNVKYKGKKSSDKDEIGQKMKSTLCLGFD